MPGIFRRTRPGYDKTAEEENALMEIEAQNTPRISVIEVTFEDGTSDTIQFMPDEKPSHSLYGWTRRRIGKKTRSDAFTMRAIAAYLYQAAIRGESIEQCRLDIDSELGKAYQKCRKLKST